MLSLPLSLLLAITVKAQGCVINPVNPKTLTADGTVLQIGTQNITITCYCSYGFNEGFNEVSWFFNGTRILSEQNLTKEHPYVVLSDITTTKLVIPIFNESYSGIYTCGNDNYTVKGSIHLLFPVKPGMYSCICIIMHVRAILKYV